VRAGRHDGYRRLAAPVWHERTIVVLPGLYWLVVDAFDGVGEHRVEQRFHVTPGAYVGYAESGDGVDIAKDGAALSLRWAQGGAPPALRLDLGVSEMHFGRPERSWFVTAERWGRAPFALALAAASDPGVRVSWAAGAEAASRLTVSGADFQHQIFLRRAAERRTTLPGGWSTDAAVAIVRTPAAGPQDVLLVGAGTDGSGGVERLVLDPPALVRTA
jgi:hypothetical protein